MSSQNLSTEEITEVIDHPYFILTIACKGRTREKEDQGERLGERKRD